MIIEKKNFAHWPNLNTVMMVEDTLKKINESVFSVADIKRNLPKQVNHNTLLVILRYLEKSNKIAISVDGISWLENNNTKLRDSINNGMRI